MASVEELKKLSRDQLNEFATQNGVENAGDLELYKTKGDLAAVLSPLVTEDMLAQFLGKDDDQSGAGDNGDDGSEQPDPATTPAVGSDEVSGDIEVGDRVSYPHAESFGGRRTGRVLEINGNSAYVRYVDGSMKLYGLSSLKLVSKG